MSKRSFLVAVSLLLLAVSTAGKALAGAKVLDPSLPMEVSGVVVLEKHYGEPNFGRTPKKDVVVVVPVLILDMPISIEADEDKGFLMPHLDVLKVQLVSLPLHGKWKGYQHKHVIVRGTLFEASTASHYTDILDDVMAVREQ